MIWTTGIDPRWGGRIVAHLIRSGFLLAVVIAGLCGCRSVGPITVPADRFNYNQAQAQSSNEQMLLNIVRLRYGEPIYFMELASVLSQYTLQATGEVSSWENNLNTWSNPALRAVYNIDSDPSSQDTWGANLQYTDRPTITYRPLQGGEFATRVMTPIQPLTLIYLAQSGWGIDRILACCVQQINGIQNAPVKEQEALPAPPEDEEAEEPQAGEGEEAETEEGGEHEASGGEISEVAGDEQRGDEAPDDEGADVSLAAPPPVAGVGADDVRADGAVAEGGDGGGKEEEVPRFIRLMRLLKKMQDEGRLVVGIEVSRDERAVYLYRRRVALTEESKDLGRMLGLTERAERIRLTASAVRRSRDELAMQTRSLYAILFTLAHHFTPPEAHLRDGQVSPSTEWLAGEEEARHWLDIRHGRLPARNAFVQVYYKGYWFYIANNDANSKRTFALITYLFSLQATETAGGLPVVTVQAGS